MTSLAGLLLLFALFCKPVLSGTGLVDADVKYVVLLHKNFNEATKDVLAASDLVPMTGKNGEKFSCYIPTAESLQMEGEAKDTTSDKHQLEKFRRELSRCSVLKDGFWTYELCPFKGVRQFHQDDNAQSSTEFSLGAYSGHHLSSPDSGSSPRTYVQTFESGTDGRRSTAVFQCAEPGRSIGLSAVQEDPIHVYTLTVLSPLACGITASPAALIGSTAVNWQDQCVRQVQRWWTLEVCPGHNVRQYHKEDDGSITEVVLGKFEASKSKLQQAEPEKNAKVSANQLHYAEQFESGDECAETGTARSAIVRYFCQLGDAPRDAFSTPRRRVARVTEVRTCVYEIDVVVPRLCSHSAFKNEVERANAVVDISCIPKKSLDAESK